MWQKEWDKSINKLLCSICKNVSFRIKIPKLGRHQETTLFRLRTEDIGLTIYYTQGLYNTNHPLVIDSICPWFKETFIQNSEIHGCKLPIFHTSVVKFYFKFNFSRIRLQYHNR